METFRHWLDVLVCDEKKSFSPPSNTSTFSRHPRLLLLVLLSRTGRKGFKLLPSAEKDPPTQKKGPTMLSAIHAVVGTDGRTWMDALCFSLPPPRLRLPSLAPFPATASRPIVAVETIRESEREDGIRRPKKGASPPPPLSFFLSLSCLSHHFSDRSSRPSSPLLLPNTQCMRT